MIGIKFFSDRSRRYHDDWGDAFTMEFKDQDGKDYKLTVGESWNQETSMTSVNIDLVYPDGNELQLESIGVRWQ